MDKVRPFYENKIFTTKGSKSLLIGPLSGQKHYLQEHIYPKHFVHQPEYDEGSNPIHFRGITT